MKKLGLLALVAVSMFGVADSAQAIVVGTGTDGNCFPFGCAPGASTRYQQVYAASDFAGPFSISSVSFYLLPQFGTTPNVGTYTLGVSTTAAAVNGLSAAFDTNVGADNVTVYSGALPSIVGDVLTFTFSQAFLYNPGAGNLLLDFSTVITTPGSAYFAANNGDAGGLYSRIHDYGSAFEDWGLVTGFNEAGAVPEPASWMMMIGGFGLVGGAMRRRRTSITFA